MKFFCDINRHLVCLPYSVENLHIMAKELGIKRCWFHRSRNGLCHYDIPVRRAKEIVAKCEVVYSPMIVMICEGRLNDCYDDGELNRAEQELTRGKSRSSETKASPRKLRPIQRPVPSSKPEVCRLCNGIGVIEVGQPLPGLYKDCPTCRPDNG